MMAPLHVQRKRDCGRARGVGIVHAAACRSTGAGRLPRTGWIVTRMTRCIACLVLGVALAFGFGASTASAQASEGVGLWPDNYTYNPNPDPGCGIDSIQRDSNR